MDAVGGSVTTTVAVPFIVPLHVPSLAVMVYWYVPAVLTVCVNESALPVPANVPWAPPGDRFTVYVTPVWDPLSVIVTLFDTFEHAVGVVVPTLYAVGAGLTTTLYVTVAWQFALLVLLVATSVTVCEPVPVQRTVTLEFVAAPVIVPPVTDQL